MNKINHVLALAGVVAAVLLSANQLQAQAGGGGGGGGGGGKGGGKQGGGKQGGGTFNPAQMIDAYKDRLQITSDDEWTAIRPLIEKVTTARQENMAFMGRGGRGGRGGGGGGGGGGGTVNPTADALQTAIDSGTPDQIKVAMDKYRAARKDAAAKLVAAQEALKKVLNVKQEAIALESSLVD